MPIRSMRKCLLSRFKYLVCRLTRCRVFGIEHCHLCGRRQPCVWWCESDDMWNQVTGADNGEGVLCPRCFEKLAARRGVSLRWIALDSEAFMKREQEHAVAIQRLESMLRKAGQWIDSSTYRLEPIVDEIRRTLKREAS